MPADPVFLDTAALIALAIKSDGLHQPALEVRRRLSADSTPVVTSQWVITEFLGGAARGQVRTVALRMTEALLASARITVAEATGAAWNDAYRLYRERADKDWSLVDCTSILICQSRGIRRVFTHDHHFAQAGFEILL